MEWIAALGRTMGFSFAAGINLYATVAILGLASRYNWVALPPQYQAFDNDFIIATALGLYVVEFVADKIPYVDTIWDSVHTLIRPVGGALVAAGTVGDASPSFEVIMALLGGTTPLVAEWVMSRSGVSLAPAMYLTAAAAVACVGAFLLPKTPQHSLTKEFDAARFR